MKTIVNVAVPVILKGSIKTAAIALVLTVVNIVM